MSTYCIFIQMYSYIPGIVSHPFWRIDSDILENIWSMSSWVWPTGKKFNWTCKIHILLLSIAMKVLLLHVAVYRLHTLNSIQNINKFIFCNCLPCEKFVVQPEWHKRLGHTCFYSHDTCCPSVYTRPQASDSSLKNPPKH